LSKIKTSLLLKIGFILPLILFADYLLMVLLGCATCLFGFGDDFYCGPYCLLGKIILGLSGLFFIILISPDIAEMIKLMKNVKTTEK
jgi:hypothetical protein